jgi:hypothetical protein
VTMTRFFSTAARNLVKFLGFDKEKLPPEYNEAVWHLLQARRECRKGPLPYSLINQCSHSNSLVAS